MPNKEPSVTTGWSPFATRYPDLKRDRPRTDPVYGLCIHTSGGGVLTKAKKLGKHPDLVALTYYQSATYSTHYVAGLNGFYQLTSETERVMHIGAADEKRGRTAAQVRKWYLSGEWRKELPSSFIKRWDERWGSYDGVLNSPPLLYPTTYPNSCYVAIECIPCDGYTKSLQKGARYTTAQHVWCALLACDMAERYDWPDGWFHSPRLATHEDLAPHNRITKGEGWDPGVLRKNPWFDWKFFQSWCIQGATLFKGKLGVMAEMARKV